MAYKIGYSDKAYGGRWTYQDANEIKEVVNRNAELLENVEAAEEQLDGDISALNAEIDELRRKIGLLTPQKVASEDAMLEMIESGNFNPEQHYYTVEE